MAVAQSTGCVPADPAGRLRHLGHRPRMAICDQASSSSGQIAQLAVDAMAAGAGFSANARRPAVLDQPRHPSTERLWRARDLVVVAAPAAAPAANRHRRQPFVDIQTHAGDTALHPAFQT